MTIHWFFSLGINPRPAVYYRDAAEELAVERRFVTTALLDLEWPVAKVERADLRLHLLPTKELDDGGTSQSPFAQFEGELDAVAPGLSERLQRHALLERRDAQAIWRVVEAVLEQVQDGDEVVLETTNGIRSIVTGFVLACGLLLAHRKGVRVRAVTYAELGADHKLPAGVTSQTVTRGSPVVDQLPFLRLFDWSHAVRAMSQYLDPTPTLALLRESTAATLSPDAAQHLEELGAALALNFPVEIERSLAAWNALGAIEDSNPAAALALRHIGGALGALGLALSPEATEHAPPLDARRLEFDLALIERLIAAQRYADAARAVREWIVNAVLVAWSLGGDWLRPSVRGRAERSLHGIPNTSPADVLTLRDLWGEASRMRNAVSHLKYNEKHEIDATTLREFLNGAPARLRALRASESSPFALAQTVEVRRYLSNAFSVNMLARSEISASFKRLKASKAREEAVGRQSVVGHRETAAIFSALLGTEVAYDRQSVSLDQGDTVLVGQYSGERLPEGCTALPPGATITWYLVELY